MAKEELENLQLLGSVLIILSLILLWCWSCNNSDNMVERLSRVTGLNETGISAIKYDEVNKKLFIAYTNSNIDILFRNDIFNIPEIKRSNIIGDKNIYTTSEDLFKWTVGLNNGKLLSKESLNLMYTKGETISGRRVPYGFGFRIDPKDKNIIYHSTRLQTQTKLQPMPNE